MPHRNRPADCRPHETIAIERENQRYKTRLGRELLAGRKLGSIIDVFLNAQKVNAPLDVLASDGAILMSLLDPARLPARRPTSSATP